MSKYTVRVYHDYYGCDTGCCGHRFEITSETGHTRDRFDFHHIDKEDALVRAQQIVRANWPDSIDWSTIDISELGDC